MAKFKGRKKDEYLASKQFFIPLQLNRFPSIFLRIIYPLFAFQMKDYRLDLFWVRRGRLHVILKNYCFRCLTQCWVTLVWSCASFVKDNTILSQGFRNNSPRFLLTPYSPVERCIFLSESILIASTLAWEIDWPMTCHVCNIRMSSRESHVQLKRFNVMWKRNLLCCDFQWAYLLPEGQIWQW